MKQLDEKVRNLFEKQALWYMGIASGDADISVIGFKELTPDGRFILCDVFMSIPPKILLQLGLDAIMLRHRRIINCENVQ